MIIFFISPEKIYDKMVPKLIKYFTLKLWILKYQIFQAQIKIDSFFTPIKKGNLC